MELRKGFGPFFIEDREHTGNAERSHTCLNGRWMRAYSWSVTVVPSSSSVKGVRTSLILQREYTRLANLRWCLSKKLVWKHWLWKKKMTLACFSSIFLPTYSFCWLLFMRGKRTRPFPLKMYWKEQLTCHWLEFSNILARVTREAGNEALLTGHVNTT